MEEGITSSLSSAPTPCPMPPLLNTMPLSLQHHTPIPTVPLQLPPPPPPPPRTVTTIGEAAAAPGLGTLVFPPMMVVQPPGGAAQVINPPGIGAGGLGFVGRETAALPMPMPMPVSRERKKHKCSVCSKITRAKCNFRACKKCCIEARNPCSVHKHFHPKSQNGVSGTIPPGVKRFMTRWSASSSSILSKSEPFGRPALGYIPMYHAIPQMYPQPLNLMKVPSPAGVVSSSSRKASTPAGAAITKPSSNETPMAKEQQDLVRSRNLKAAFLASQKEVASINAWRFQKVKEYIDAELNTVDEAFDRYMQNASLLEEIFVTSGRSSENLAPNIDTPLIHSPPEVDRMQERLSVAYQAEFLDAMRALLDANIKRKDIRKQKLKRVIASSLHKVKRGEVTSDGYIDADSGSHFSLSDLHRDIKRMKVESKKAKDSLERIKAWDSLQQKLDAIKNMNDIHELVETYSTAFSDTIFLFLPDMVQVVDVQAANAEKNEAKEGTSPDKFVDPKTIEEGSAAILEPASCLLRAESEGTKVPQPSSVKCELLSPVMNTAKMITLAVARNRTENSVISDYQKFITGLGWWKVQSDESVIQEMGKSFLNTAGSFAEL